MSQDVHLDNDWVQATQDKSHSKCKILTNTITTSQSIQNSIQINNTLCTGIIRCSTIQAT